jgi:hypothetical protein
MLFMLRLQTVTPHVPHKCHQYISIMLANNIAQLNFRNYVRKHTHHTWVYDLLTKGVLSPMLASRLGDMAGIGDAVAALGLPPKLFPLGVIGGVLIVMPSSALPLLKP